MIDDKTTREELGAIVCQALEAAGYKAVLVGGAVVSIYTQNMFPSDDLDMVVNRSFRQLQPILRRLGFTEFVHNRAVHAAARYYVQLLEDTVAIGEKQPIHPVDFPTAVGTLRMLSPLDCVLDRLASFLHYNDRPALRQAVEVALRHDVDTSEVRKWFDGEQASSPDKADKLSQFLERLAKRKREGAVGDKGPPDDDGPAGDDWSDDD